MKRVLLYAGVLFGITLSAQQPVTPGPAVQTSAIFDQNRYTEHYQTDRSTSWWLNYALHADSVYGNVATLNGNYLFPDSSVLGEFGAGNFAPVWIHSLTQTLDPTSSVFQSAAGCTMTDVDGYSVDSMGIYYLYERNINNPAVVDTLYIKLSHTGTAANFLSSGFIGTTASNYGTDTVGFKSQKYDYVNNMATGTTTTTYVKVPLTVTDSSAVFVAYKAFSVNNFVVPAGRVVGVSISFIPGYTYSFGDTLETALNSFQFLSYEEQGAGTYPFYTDCNYQSADCDYNVSGIVRSQERYNVTGNSWNGNYIPTYAFTQPYSLEHHLIDWLVTTPPTSVNEISAAGISIGQNVPNPANGNTTVNYSLVNGGEVTFTITDIAGKVVYTSNEGNKQAGNHAIGVNTENLSNGVYFYTVTVDGAGVTQKMTVAH
jgi:hypothetical protein